MAASCRPLMAIGGAAAAAVFAACGGSDGGGATPAPTLPATVTQSPEPVDAFVLYRDSNGNIVARNLLTEESYQYPIDFTSEVIVSAVCSPSGERIALLRQPFDVTNRELEIAGEEAPAEPIVLPSNVQGIEWSPDGARIAYTEFDGFENVYRVSVVDVASTETAELATGEGVAGSPSWSPDGTTIAFGVQDVMATRSDVYVVGAGGGVAQTRVADEGALRLYDPEWTPDGGGILVAGQGEDNVQIYRLDPETGSLQALTSSADIYKRGPEYAPDGSAIAYTGSIILPTVARYVSVLHQFGIFLLDPDGGNERALTSDPRENPGAGVDPYLDAFLLGWCRPGAWLDDAWVPYEEPVAS